jgi:hypothetical protein
MEEDEAEAGEHYSSVLQRDLGIELGTRKLLHRQETQDSAFSEELPRHEKRGILSRQVSNPGSPS